METVRYEMRERSGSGSSNPVERATRMTTRVGAEETSWSDGLNGFTRRRRYIYAPQGTEWRSLQGNFIREQHLHDV